MGNSANSVGDGKSNVIRNELGDPLVGCCKLITQAELRIYGYNEDYEVKLKGVLGSWVPFYERNHNRVYYFLIPTKSGNEVLYMYDYLCDEIVFDPKCVFEKCPYMII
jgi:hypothetical protein